MDQPGTLRDFSPKAQPVVDDPARRRNLDDAGIVKGILLRIEIRVGPDRGELGSADGIGPVGRLQVDSIPNPRQLAFGVEFAAT